MSNSSPVKIYVLGSGSLLDEGITNMLNLQPQLNVTKIPYIDDARLHDLANLEHPYTILINEFDVRVGERAIVAHRHDVLEAIDADALPALLDLASLEHPYTILINEFDVRDITRIVILLFSAPSAFARRVIVVRDRNSKLDVYDKPMAHVPTANYQRKSVVVKTKQEFIDLALRSS